MYNSVLTSLFHNPYTEPYVGFLIQNNNSSENLALLCGKDIGEITFENVRSKERAMRPRVKMSRANLISLFRLKCGPQKI